MSTMVMPSDKTVVVNTVQFFHRLKFELLLALQWSPQPERDDQDLDRILSSWPIEVKKFQLHPVSELHIKVQSMVTLACKIPEFRNFLWEEKIPLVDTAKMACYLILAASPYLTA